MTEKETDELREQFPLHPSTDEEFAKVRVLLRKELDHRLRIPTTKEQAEQIVRRNKPLLDAIEKGEEFKGFEGCPHCVVDEEGGCAECAWNALNRAVLATSGFLSCIAARWGGVAANKVSRETLCDSWLGLTYFVDQETYMPTDSVNVEDARKVVVGHIEWAECVIRRWKELERKTA